MSNNNTTKLENPTQGHMTIADTKLELNRQHKVGTHLPTQT